MREHDLAIDGAGLQFDRAELGDAPPGGVTCGICHGKVSNEYFQVDGAVACAACKDVLVRARAGGSGVARLVKAGGLGILAAVAGAAIWIAIVRMTGYEIGLVAIGVGFLVGAAVRRGSGGRGGWAYQTMAVVLTYAAMVAYYVPYVIEGIAQGSEEGRAAAQGGSAPAQPSAAPSDAAPGAAPAGSAAAAVPAPKIGVADVVLAVAVVVGIAFAAPFLAGAENLIGILILLFALYEAWRLNRRQGLTVTGPFQVATSDAAGPPVAPA